MSAIQFGFKLGYPSSSNGIYTHFAMTLCVVGLAYLIGYRICKQPTSISNVSRVAPARLDPLEKFTRPIIVPCFLKLDELEPQVYRPFKPGPYNINMGIRSMPWGDWVQVDHDFQRYHAIRTRRLRTRGSKVTQYLSAKEGVFDGGKDAAYELAKELAWFLSSKYPNVFRATFAAKNGGPDSVQTITILPLNVTYNLETEEPLHVVAQIVQDDFAILKEGMDGAYYLVGGAIITAGSWRLEEKIGMSLDEIHLSGNVPKFEQKLQPSLTKFFRRLTVDTPYSRNNYQFQVVDRSSSDALDPDDLAWCTATNGPEDFEPFSCPATLDPEYLTPENIMFRVERQTLRRLPRTKAVVFSIRTYLTPLDKLACESGVPERLASAVRGWSDDVWAYKKGDLYGAALLEKERRVQRSAYLLLLWKDSQDPNWDLRTALSTSPMSVDE